MLKLAPLWCYQAVFQREMPIPLRGRCNPGETVRATLAGNTVTGRADDAGNFLLQLPPLAAGRAGNLVVELPETGEKEIVRDILIGDVWLASGQSNMAYQLGSRWSVDGPDHQQLSEAQLHEFAEHLSELPPIRFFQVPCRPAANEMEECRGPWITVDRSSAAGVSAVAAWFARFIGREVKVPIGLIVSAVGGTRIEAWSSRAALGGDPDELSALQNLEDEAPPEPDDEALVQKWEQLMAEVNADASDWSARDFDDSAWGSMELPGSWIVQKKAALGAVRFRKEVVLPPGWENSPLVLRLGVDKCDVAYWNGREIGRTGSGFDIQYWNLLRCYPVDPDLICTGRNVISVCAGSFSSDGSFTVTPALVREDTGEILDLSGPWKIRQGFVWTPPPQKEEPAVQEKADRVNQPTALYNGMLHPLFPVFLRGILWYQGEHNARTVKSAVKYRKQLAAFVSDLRKRLHQPELPFLQVLLANYHAPADFDADAAWAALRESQLGAEQDMDGVYSASAIDLGEEKEVHPQNKKEVGRRLAQIALKKVYRLSEALERGPQFVRMTPEAGGVRLRFRNAAGLTLKPGGEGAFFLAGADREFHAADFALAEDDTLFVRSSVVAAPCALRYNWADNPRSVLVNGAGLPADPFRSDDWPLPAK